MGPHKEDSTFEGHGIISRTIERIFPRDYHTHARGGIRERDKSTMLSMLLIVLLLTFYTNISFLGSKRARKICLMFMQFHPKLTNYKNFELRSATFLAV